jgi:hypothetical protein
MPFVCGLFVFGGDKTGDDRFYERMIPVADVLYDTYVEEIRKGGGGARLDSPPRCRKASPV